MARWTGCWWHAGLLSHATRCNHARPFVGISQKSISKRPCQFLAINAHKMAPRPSQWPQDRTWDTPTKGLLWDARCASKASLRTTGVFCTCGRIYPCSGRDCVKSLRPSYTGLHPPTRLQLDTETGTHSRLFVGVSQSQFFRDLVNFWR